MTVQCIIHNLLYCTLMLCTVLCIILYYRHDGGEYLCQAQNGVGGPARRLVSIVVQCELPFYYNFNTNGQAFAYSLSLSLSLFLSLALANSMFILYFS